MHERSKSIEKHVRKSLKTVFGEEKKAPGTTSKQCERSRPDDRKKRFENCISLAKHDASRQRRWCDGRVQDRGGQGGWPGQL